MVRMTVLGGTKGSPYDCFIEVRGPMARVSLVLFSDRDWKSPAAMVLYLVSQSSYRSSLFFRMSPVTDCRKVLPVSLVSSEVVMFSITPCRMMPLEKWGLILP